VGVLDANRSSSVDLCFKRDGVAWSRTCLPIQSTRQGFSSGRSGRPFKRGHSIPPRATGYRAHPYKTPIGLTDWQSRDPIGVKGGINLYNYVKNNPINRKDKKGLCDVGAEFGVPSEGYALGQSMGASLPGDGAFQNQLNNQFTGMALGAAVPGAIALGIEGAPFGALGSLRPSLYVNFINFSNSQELMDWAAAMLASEGISSELPPTSYLDIIADQLNDFRKDLNDAFGNESPFDEICPAP